MSAKTIYTIGHSTRSFDELVTLLHHYDVNYLVDVRTIPRSRTNPQFNQAIMGRSMAQAGIGYQHIAALGGLRHTTKQSVNTAWRNKSFRGYADYMQTAEFRSGLDQLLALTADYSVVIMCAEAVPWRCHRSMIGDALIVAGYQVTDIFDEAKAVPEKLTSFARVDGQQITYPG